MGDFLRNIGYFLSEVKTIFVLNGFSSALSMVSLTLIFFVVLLAVSGWQVSTDLVNSLQNQAEISVYYGDSISGSSVEGLEKSIRSIDGVKNVTAVTAKEAYGNMSQILGPDASVLSNFEQNPFDGYLEVNIAIDKLAPILKAVEKTAGVDYVRDNQTVLEKLRNIANVVTTLGIIIAIAVSASTFIITSHIIREGVHSHRDQINTLKLLGAPDWFIYSPFIIEGVLLTTVSGVASGALYGVFVNRFDRFVSDSIPFLPAVNIAAIVQSSVIGMLIASAIMGFGASVFGLRMVQTK